MITLYEMSRIGKSIETESRLVVARGGVGEEKNGDRLLLGMGFSEGDYECSKIR